MMSYNTTQHYRSSTSAYSPPPCGWDLGEEEGEGEGKGEKGCTFNDFYGIFMNSNSVGISKSFRLPQKWERSCVRDLRR